MIFHSLVAAVVAVKSPAPPGDLVGFEMQQQRCYVLVGPQGYPLFL